MRLRQATGQNGAVVAVLVSCVHGGTSACATVVASRLTKTKWDHTCTDAVTVLVQRPWRPGWRAAGGGGAARHRHDRPGTHHARGHVQAALGHLCTHRGGIACRVTPERSAVKFQHERVEGDNDTHGGVGTPVSPQRLAPLPPSCAQKEGGGGSRCKIGGSVGATTGSRGAASRVPLGTTERTSTPRDAECCDPRATSVRGSWYSSRDPAPSPRRAGAAQRAEAASAVSSSVGPDSPAASSPWHHRRRPG